MTALVGVASPASAGTPCEPRAASSYRYDPTVLNAVFVLRLCDPVDETTFEIQFDRLNLITGEGVTAFILGVAECRGLLCATTYRQSHGNELARYDIHVFWFGAADDRIGPLLCATRDAAAACRSRA